MISISKALHYIAAVTFLSWSGVVFAQEPSPPPKPPIEVTDVKIESASVAGSSKPWLRLLASFVSRPNWADGVVFYFDVLVEKDGQYRTLSGTTGYSNVKRGQHAAGVYLSPSSFERFGSPVAVSVQVAYGDEELAPFLWESPGKTSPSNWIKTTQRFPNQLMPINLTPFVATEYGKYPDLMVR